MTDPAGRAKMLTFLLAIASSSCSLKPIAPQIGAGPGAVVDFSESKPISPYIYGANSDDFAHLGPNLNLVREGGNRMTAYNWETNASNAGSDYKFQNDDFMARDLPAGQKQEPGAVMRNFLQKAQSNGAAAILTVPTAGYVSADEKGDGDVRQTPNFINVRFLKSYARKPGGHYIYPPDLNDHAVYQDEFVSWIEKIKSAATPVWFMLDNEPDLWGSTHNEIWPKSPTYAQIIANNVEFSSAIKDVAPQSLIFGPANYGWQGFRRFQDAPDANGRDFLNTYLDAMKDAGEHAGHRLLDVLDVHWYPEARGDNVRVTESGSKPGTAFARIMAPRSLWDPKYVESSWIADSLGRRPIVLLPRIEDQIEAHYPGTKFSISEYNYGGNNDISGAIAQADVLGIFGRYGLFAACNWGLSAGDMAELAGFKAFQDYDRHGAKFADLELPVEGVDPTAGSVYAALDSHDPHRVTIVFINKTFSPGYKSVRLNGFTASSARTFTVTKANFAGAPDAGTADIKSDGIGFQAAAMSITTIEVQGTKK
jgi:hypothetical protein